jgi:hypothetical protein
MAVEIENIGGEICEPISGFTPKLFWAHHKDFQTINDPKDICDENGNGATNFSELIEIPTSHVFKAGKKFHTVDFDVETAEMLYPTIGEKHRRVYDNSFKVEISGSSAELLGFCRYIRNQKVVVLGEELGSGNLRQMGSKRFPAWVEIQEGSIEALVEGKNSVVITFKDKQKWMPPIYKGDVLTDDDSE